MARFKCICYSGVIPEKMVLENLSKEEITRLERIRLSRKIDKNPNMIFCPTLNCEKEIEKRGKSSKLECAYCGNFACFKC